jgi:glycosyltransferase involved in cell wall biosynthesis
LVEGRWVTGPIKPLLMFARNARIPKAGEAPIDLSVLVTDRRSASVALPPNQLIAAATDSRIMAETVAERHVGDPRVVRQLVAAIRRRQPRIVETHQVKSHFLLLQALWWGGLRRSFRWLAFHHGYTSATTRLRLYEQLDRMTLRFPDRVITVCEPFAQTLADRGVQRARLSVLTNFAEAPEPPVDGGRALRSSLKIAATDLVIVSIGRLSPEKGQRYLLAAIADVLRRCHVCIRVLIVGDGPDRSELEKLAMSSGIGGHVSFLGHQTDVWPYHWLADLFVLPSLSEGSPLALLESMAATKPIVATRVGGVPEVVRDGESALLVPAGNVPALARAIETMLNDAGLRSRLSTGAALAARRLTPAHYVTNLRRIYQDVLQRERGAR